METNTEEITLQSLANLIISTKNEITEGIEDLARITAEHFIVMEEKMATKADLETIKTDVGIIKSDVFEQN